MAEVHQIVIIGASFAGIPVAHGLLKDVLPALSAGGKQAYKVTLVSLSEYFYFKIGSPRTIVNPSALPVEKVMLPIANGFKKYKPEQFEFVLATVTSIDPTSKTIQTDKAGSLHYDTLVLASGTKFNSPIWSISNGSEATKAALQDMHTRIPAAKSVLVAGGGPAGVETMGELAQTYGGKKELTLLSGSTGLLHRLQNKSVGKDAQERLEKAGVKIINDNIKVTNTRKDGEQTLVELSNGTQKAVDVFIEAMGDKPNSSFVPSNWLNDKGYVKSDGQTLRLNVPGVTGVYCIGTVASWSDGSVLDTKFTTKPLLESIKLDLQGQQPGPRTKNIYKKFTSDMQFVPLGSTQGVGVAMGYKLPSFVVKFAKAKDFMIGNAAKTVEGTG